MPGTSPLRGSSRRPARALSPRPADVEGGYGLTADELAGTVRAVTSNLTNPKMAVFFLAFLPQFVPPGPQAPERTALLGLVFNAIASSWWVTYVLLLHRADALLQRPRVQHALERVTGLALIGLGLRQATQHPWPGTSSGPVP